MTDLSKVFGATQQGVPVEVKRKRGSAAGDAIRQGRVKDGQLAPPARTGAGKVILTFEPRDDGCIYVKSRVAEVGVICAQRAERGVRPGYNWLCFLPEQRSKPQFAADLDKAKDAIRSCVETWCEAAGLAARGQHPHRHKGGVVGWRAK
jgi:hypothetical protein